MSAKETKFHIVWGPPQCQLEVKTESDCLNFFSQPNPTATVPLNFMKASSGSHLIPYITVLHRREFLFLYFYFFIIIIIITKLPFSSPTLLLAVSLYSYKYCRLAPLPPLNISHAPSKRVYSTPPKIQNYNKREFKKNGSHYLQFKSFLFLYTKKKKKKKVHSETKKITGQSPRSKEYSFFFVLFFSPNYIIYIYIYKNTPSFNFYLISFLI